jgi:predicted ATP-grasp superfamily ATP-dependent carboligase
LRLLVYEYVSGGGLAKKPIPPSILSEGFGMLRAMVSDFKAAGHSVTTVLDSRLYALNAPLEAERVVPVSSLDEADVAVRKVAAEQVDAVCVIAPESEGVLRSLIASVERTGTPLLNCSSVAVGKVADKFLFQEHVKRLGLSTPESLMVSVHEGVEVVSQSINEEVGFPAVTKPLDGVGCAGLSIVLGKNDVPGAIAKIRKESAGKFFMAQQFIKGDSVSVSVISNGEESLPISLNKQDVSLGTPDSASSYNGGIVPFDSSLKRKAFELAKRVVESLRGAKGYVGVDLILGEAEAFVVEVNPRLTTSYMGMRKIAQFDPAEAMLNSALEGKLPHNHGSVGYACFSKVKAPKPTIEAVKQTYDIEEIVSPPFPISTDDSAWALFCSHSNTLENAKRELDEASKKLLGKSIGGGQRW